MARAKKSTLKVSRKNDSNRSTFSIIVGFLMIAVGLVMLIGGIVSIILYRLPASVDSALPVPVLDAMPAFVNTKSLTVKGDSSDYERVMVFVNDQVVTDGVKSDENGKFRYIYEIEDEGDYRIQVAGIKGFPRRVRSEKGKMWTVNADFTAPSSDVKFAYDKEVDTKAFTLRGVVEENSTVVLEKNGKKYIAKADMNGGFVLKDIPLTDGENQFSVEIRDEAGNVTKLSQKISVTYASGQLNGNGAVDLPEASGILSDALNEVKANALIGYIGMIALVVLLLNSVLVGVKLRRELV